MRIGENIMARTQRTYDNEYKTQAVKLAQEIGGAKAVKNWAYQMARFTAG